MRVLLFELKLDFAARYACVRASLCDFGETLAEMRRRKSLRLIKAQQSTQRKQDFFILLYVLRRLNLAMLYLPAFYVARVAKKYN